MNDNTIDEPPFVTTHSHASSDPFRLLVEAIKDYGIFMLDQAGNVSSWNPGAEKINGYKADEIIGKHFSCFYTPEDAGAGLPQQGLRVALEERRFEEEGLWVRKGGEPFEAIVTIADIRDSFEQHIGFAVVTRDITERKRAERALRQKETELAEAVRLARVGYWNRDLATGKLNCSDNLHDIFGTGRAGIDTTFESFMEILHPADRPVVSDRIARAVASVGAFDHTYRVLVGEEVRTIHEIGHAIAGADGRARRVVGTAQDVTERARAESAIVASESRFRAFMDHTPASSFIKDEDGRYLYVNSTWLRQFGECPPEWQGKTDRDLWPGETADLFRANDIECLTRTSVVQKEETAQTPVGGKTTWLTTKFPLVEGDNRLIGGMAWDISDRKRAEEAVILSEVRYRRLFEAAQDGVLIVDAVSRRIFDTNPYLTDVLGFSREEIVGKELWEIGLYRDIESNKEAFCKLQTEGYIRYDDLPLRTKLGNSIAVEVVANIYEVGDVEVVQCNIRDITDRKRAEGALLLRDRAIATMVQGLVITDPNEPDNPMIYVNDSFLKMTGYERREVIGRNCRFLQGPETDPESVARIREAIRQERPCLVDLLNYRKDGSRFWNGLSISPIRDRAGRLTHFVGVQTDVSPLKLMERQFHQSQKMEAIGQLAGGVAHDFNNLLTIISGYSELILETLTSDDPNRQAIEEIGHAGKRAEGLTRQLLFFSRRAVLEPKVLDLNEVVREAKKLLRRTIGEDIVFTARLDPTISRVRADRGQMGQVLMNLVINARDAMYQGGELTIETADVRLDGAYTAEHPECRPGRYVMLAVGDNGSGMTPEVQARVFEPFFTTKLPGMGTGLGLATVHGIVEQSGGSIDIHSELGRGTIFKIYLPVVDASVQTGEDDRVAEQTDGGRETILLVEDDDAVRKIARISLENRGYAVLQADGGREALEIADRHPSRIDLLVTDLVMPEMSGRELAEKLCSLYPELRVLYQSGYTEDTVVRHGILQAQVAFLQKPYTPLSLATKVREVLDK